MDIKLVDKLIKDGEKYIEQAYYSEIFDKSDKAIRLAVYDEKLIRIKFNKKFWIKI